MAVEVAVDYVGRPLLYIDGFVRRKGGRKRDFYHLCETVEYPGTATPASALLIEEYKFLLNYISLFW